MARLLLLNGPNLNLLGTREPEKYGHDSLKQVEARCAELARSLGHELHALQSNAEHVLIDTVHAARTDGTAFIVINPGAYCHTSIALRDAFLSATVPFIEVHISNVAARESFRHHSYLSDVAVGFIVGLGTLGYELAIQAAARKLGAGK